MTRLEIYIRDRFEEAVQARGDAECGLASLAEQGEDFTIELRTVAELRAVARWWERVLAELDQGAGAFDALWLLRGDARRALIGPPAPRASCPFVRGFADASITGTRAFYDQTAHVQELSLVSRPAR
jgi:hypothetical protein